MALGSGNKNIKVVPEAYQAMNQFKYEVATELGINPEYKSGYWGNISSRECGAVGGAYGKTHDRRCPAVVGWSRAGCQFPRVFPSRAKSVNP